MVQVKDLQDQIGMSGNRPFLFSPITGEEYAAISNLRSIFT